MLHFLQAKLIAKLCVIAGLPLAAVVYSPLDRPLPVPDGFAVTVAPRETSYRLAGEFFRDGKPVNAPLVRKYHATALVIMRTQVSAAEYGHCVEEGSCRAVGRRVGRAADEPVVGVSWEDATAYARWFSRKSGQNWRLPTDEEWAFLAAERFNDDAVATSGEGGFSERWLAKYDSETARNDAADRVVRPFGTFGVNGTGLSDVAGNVWEWTDTCFSRYRLDAENAVMGIPVENCGVRVVEGRHRTYMTNFVRDARAGGCAAGVPPANLGFRLVRNDHAVAERHHGSPQHDGKS